MMLAILSSQQSQANRTLMGRVSSHFSAALSAGIPGRVVRFGTAFSSLLPVYWIQVQQNLK
jgi:hypothetical protein